MGHSDALSLAACEASKKGLRGVSNKLSVRTYKENTNGALRYRFRESCLVESLNFLRSLHFSSHSHDTWLILNLNLNLLSAMRPPTHVDVDPSRPGSTSESSEETPLLGRSENQSFSAPLKPQAVSWASIPNKGQLAVIVFARLAEPLSERSLTSYLFYQLRWFNSQLSAAEIAKQAGYLTAVFAAAQCLTSMWWGRAADDPRLGRKRVLLIGLTGSALSALGMGFSKSLEWAFFFRFLAGALNGNIGVLRTMVSEIVVDKR